MAPMWLLADLTPFLVVVLVAWVVFGCISGAHAVMYKRDARSAALWLVISFALPLVGPWLYWVLGINRVTHPVGRRFHSRMEPFDAPDRGPVPAVPRCPWGDAPNLTALKAVTDRVSRLPMLGGNRVEPLHNGESAYPAMLDAIRSATRSVTLASYIFDWDQAGRAFACALADAAKRGVHVHVLLDGLGALKTFSSMGRFLMRSGARVAPFFPLRFPVGRVRLNTRNHRKILVVDGRVGFTGGMNISSRHYLHTDSPRRVEDVHFRVEGPVVAEMQHVFAEDWQLAASQRLSGPDFFPTLTQKGDAFCRGVFSGPDEDVDTVHWTVQAGIAAATRCVRVLTPYFAPTAPLVGAMCMAAMRGVDVRLIIPGYVDQPYMAWVADANLWKLLGRGARVFKRRGPFVHTKLLLVDDTWLCFGSANYDRRSFRLNFEFNIEAYDAPLAAQLRDWVDTCCDDSDEVTLAQIDARPGWIRLRDGMARLLSPFL